MSLRFCESFDHLLYTEVQLKWLGSLANNVPIGPAYGRYGNGGIYNGSGTHTTALFDSQPTWIIGFAVKGNAASWVQPTFLTLLDTGTLHISLSIDAQQRLYVSRGGVVIGTGTTILGCASWYYIELKVTIDDSGSFQVRLNGEDEIHNAGGPVSADTRNGAAASANQIRFYGLTASTLYDDIYICDGAGSANNDFLGDVRVEAIFPSGNGNSSQLIGSDADSTDNYLLVDEAAPSTADYVESSTVSDKDTYVFGDLTPTAGSIAGIQILPYAAKTDAGSRSIVTVARLSATEEDGSAMALSSSPLYLSEIRETKPGGGAWSISDVNSAEFGVKVNS